MPLGHAQTPAAVGAGVAWPPVRWRQLPQGGAPAAARAHRQLEPAQVNGCILMQLVRRAPHLCGRRHWLASMGIVACGIVATDTLLDASAKAKFQLNRAHVPPNNHAGRPDGISLRLCRVLRLSDCSVAASSLATVGAACPQLGELRFRGASASYSPEHVSARSELIRHADIMQIAQGELLSNSHVGRPACIRHSM